MRQSSKDAAKTQVFLSASEDVKELYVHGEYWVPRWNWWQQYVGCVKEELGTEDSRDEREWGQFWEFCAGIEGKTDGAVLDGITKDGERLSERGDWTKTDGVLDELVV